MARLVFHIDVNSAYLSWEAARRVAAGEADLRLIPSAIGGDREKRTGVILAKSIPASQGLFSAWLAISELCCPTYSNTADVIPSFSSPAESCRRRVPSAASKQGDCP